MIARKNIKARENVKARKNVNARKKNIENTKVHAKSIKYAKHEGTKARKARDLADSAQQYPECVV